MQLDVAKLAKTFYKNTDKKVQTQKKNKELSSIEDRKVNNKSLLRWKKKFVTCQIQCRRYGGPCLLFWFTKNTFFATSCNNKKADNDAKRTNNIQSYLLD